MDTRVAVLSIIIDKDDSVDEVNDLLHDYFYQKKLSDLV